MTKKYSTTEETPIMLTPVEGTAPMSDAAFIAILRDKLNETIEVVNTLRADTIKIKKK